MGVACILNGRRCGRTHCRYTGPYYLAMIAPVLLLAAGIGSTGFYGWLILAVLILAGSKMIWWTTEQAWGKLSYGAHFSDLGRCPTESAKWAKPDIEPTSPNDRV